MVYDDIEIGFKIPPLLIEMSPVQMVMYCAVTWDFARLHYDPQIVQEYGLERPAVDPQMHGGLVARMLSDWLSGRGRMRSLSLKYQAPCYVGDTITYGGEVEKKYTERDVKCIDCRWTATKNSGGEPVAGRASVLFY
jgi:acyl dehydratase